MSLASLSIVETNINKLAVDIRDLENEVETNKDFIQEITSSLSRQNIRLHQLETRIKEKRNMMKTLCGLRDDRQNRLQKQNELKLKFLYTESCQEYLLEFSNHRFLFEEMMSDEIIEYAHKLHFILCLQQWLSVCHPEYYNEFDLPTSEFDFDAFEVRNVCAEDKVCIGHKSSLIGYIIFIEVWYSLYEYNNEQNFNIKSPPSIMNDVFKQMTFV
jgi:hypothetical protein